MDAGAAGGNGAECNGAESAAELVMNRTRWVSLAGYGLAAVFAVVGIMFAAIPVEDRLFVDPVLCVAAPMAGCHLDEEVPMPFFVRGDGYTISPYFDYLSFFFAREWRRPRHDIAALMIKLADSENGSLSRVRRPLFPAGGFPGVVKTLTKRDRDRLAVATEACREVLSRVGASRDSLFLGMFNAGHPGGSLPLTGHEQLPLHHDRLPVNVYVADASLLPESLGRPPSLAIMALARRIAGLCLERFL